MRHVEGWFVSPAALLLAAVIACSGAAPSAAAQGYRVVDVTPPGYSVAFVGGVGGGQRVGAALLAGNPFYRPLLWPDATRAEVIDLSSGATVREGYAYATDGQRQAGWGLGPASSGGSRALLWSGASDRYVDLTPAAMTEAHLTAMDGGRQFGWADSGAIEDHAMAWSGSAASAVDIHPAGFDFSHALGAGGGQVVGVARRNSGAGLSVHPILWSGPSLAPTDLLPGGFNGGVANATDGGRQVGFAYAGVTSGNEHALLWSGAAGGFVDLHPAGGFDASVALAIEGDTQVGYGTTAAGDRALSWRGSAESAVDLHALLPSDLEQSRALDIDAANNVHGWALDATGRGHAIVWLAVPEPAGVVPLLVIAGAASLRRRRHRCLDSTA
jgi:hypothetical protein